MKVGFDAKRLYHNKTGLGAYSRNLIKALLAHKPQHDYELFVHEKYYDNSIFKYKEFTKRTFVSHHLVADYWRIADIKEDIECEGIQIYHGLSNEIPIVKSTKCTMVATIHDLIFLRHPEFFPFIDRNIYTYKTKKACENADIIIAVSQQTKEDIISFYATAPEKIHVIAPTWDSDYEINIPIIYLEEIRTKYALPEQYIIYVGALHKRKNLANLIAAYHQSRLQDISLIIVSDGGDDEENIRKTIQQLHLEENVFIMNGIPNYELIAFYKMASLCVYPSLYEGFGMPIMEAMYMGIPVTASNIPTTREVGGDFILYFDPYDIAMMAETLYKAIHDSPWRDTTIPKAQSHIQKFSPKHCAESIVKLYGSLDGSQ